MMIGYLSGSVIFKAEHYLLLDVQGVGYEIYAPERILQNIPDRGDCALHIHMHVREDILKLYGFTSIGEKKLFLTLTKISGVGASVALALMSALDEQDIVTAVMAGDAKAFTAAQGVGPKLASRLLNELKNMPDMQHAGLRLPTAHGDNSAPSTVTESTQSVADTASPASEAVAALVSLGYTRSDAFRAVTHSANEHQHAGAETLITAALRYLSA